MFLDNYSQLAGDTTFGSSDFLERRFADDALNGRISEAISAANHNGFGFFDLGLISEDIAMLSNIEIQSFSNLLFFGNLEQFHDKTLEFITKFALAKGDADTANHITHIIEKTTRSIMEASQFESAQITLRTVHKSGELVLDAHVDKRDDEMLCGSQELGYYDIQHIFIFTLYGASTLFYPLNNSARNIWNLAINETTYLYEYKIGMGLDSLFKASNAYSPPFGYGSVHLAGLKNGTVHDCPSTGNGRLVVIVTPGNYSNIKQVEALAMLPQGVGMCGVQCSKN